MTEWKTYKLGDIGRIVTGKTPKTSILENYGGNIPFLTPSDDLSGKHSPATAKTLTQQGLLEVKNCLLPANSVCVSCIGSDLGKVVKVIQPTVTNQQFNSIIPSDDFDADFVYYLMTIVGKQLNYLSKTSTAVPIINKTQFSNFEVRVPSLEEQRRIAGILGAIDDKIECNRRINTNLESQAQALYKQWFVDFNFPNEEGKPYKSSGGKMVDSELGLIPEGWRVGNIGGYCKIRSGYAFKSSWWTDRGVKIIKIKNITENGVLDMSECSYVDIKHCDKASDFNGHAGDLIIAMTGATLGKVCIIPYHTTDYYINQRVGKFFLGDNPINKLPFIHCILRDENVMSEIINKGQGSAQPNISASDVETIKIVMPSYYIMDKFNLLLQSNYALWLKNMAEVNSFVTLRDTLLPKLMSGEIKTE